MDQEKPLVDSLFDYFYIDTGRLNHWLAQLDDGGVIESFRHSKSIGEDFRNELGMNAVIKGGQSNTQKDNESQERFYSSEWSRPLLLLDLLADGGMIHREIEDAPMGSLVLVSGEIQMFDISLLQNSWDSIKNLVMEQQGIPTHKPKASMNNTQKRALENFEMVGGMLKVLPNNPQIYLRDASGEVVWSALEPDFIIGNPSTLALSNGPFLSGQWHAIGIIDGHKEDGDNSDRLPFGDSDMSNAMSQMMQAVKDAVGRGANSYSITPLMIFRSVESRQTTEGS